MKLIEIVKHHQKELAKDEKILNKIKKDCTQIIDIYKKANPKLATSGEMFALYRGESSGVNIFKNNIRKDRVALYMPIAVTKLVTKIYDELGIEANRENSIFCGSMEIAGAWGKNRYIIFPVDGFKYMWFKKKVSDGYIFNDIKDEFIKIFDHYNGGEDYINFTDKLRVDKIFKNSDKKELIEKFTKNLTNLIKEKEPKTDQLEIGLRSSLVSEYLISGTYYYGIHLDWALDNHSEILKLFDIKE